jgi:hypothetical protein
MLLAANRGHCIQNFSQQIFSKTAVLMPIAPLNEYPAERKRAAASVLNWKNCRRCLVYPRHPRRSDYAELCRSSSQLQQERVRILCFQLLREGMGHAHALITGLTSRYRAQPVAHLLGGHNAAEHGREGLCDEHLKRYLREVLDGSIDRATDALHWCWWCPEAGL